jgi:hypothetical protein
MLNALAMLAVFLTDAQQHITADKPLPVKIMKDGVDWATRANWALVAVGIGGIFTALGTLWFIKRQANLMERQTKILEDSIAAAKDSARAAKDNIALIVNRERAIIQVEAIKIPAPPPSHLPLPPDDIVAYKVFNRGLTAAKVEYAYAIVDISETSESCSGQNSTFRKADFDSNLGSLFSPTSDGVTQYAVSEVRFDWEDINKRTKFVHFYGEVKYRDLLSEEDHVTHFHYVWWIDSQRLADGSPFGRWIERGGQEENYQT